MDEKINIGIVFGGKSAEHEISLLSVKNIVSAIDKIKYNIILIYVDKSGKWSLIDELEFNFKMLKNENEIALLPYAEQKIYLFKEAKFIKVDVIFPIIHGAFGEDGTLQGLLKSMGLPFVGSDVLGSAINMDKIMTKRLLQNFDIPVLDFVPLESSEKIPSFLEIKDKLGPNCFVKPSNCGSSIGISKIHNENEYLKAVNKAFEYDHKVIIEKAIKAREIECAVLGNKDPAASTLGEIVCNYGFYSYEAKYIDENAAILNDCVDLDIQTTQKIQNLALKAFKVLMCSGFARVDFFLDENNKIFLNEINTMPGFTKISMYPKLWDKSGIKYPELVDKLVQFAIEKFKLDQKLKINYI